MNRKLVLTAAIVTLGLVSCATEETGTLQGEAGAQQTETTVVVTTLPTTIKELPEMTGSQANALRSAEDYLEFTNFSRIGLIGQLEFEGYSTEDATFAVDLLDVDWNAQAVGSAEDYLQFSGFSCEGLIEQLEFEEFTSDQAIHGAGQTSACS